jgi:hypothetical protein
MWLVSRAEVMLMKEKISAAASRGYAAGWLAGLKLLLMFGTNPLLRAGTGFVR